MIDSSPALGSVIASPDPVLSVNVYCSGRLSEVIHLVVAPFWQQVRASCRAGAGDLWLMRYGRRGDHLKIRFHGPPAERDRVRDLLSAALRRYFAELGPPDPHQQRSGRALATPIDEEDAIAEDHPDRAFLWTHYRRSHVSLGAAPYLRDDIHVGLLVRSLARSTDIVLASLRTDATGHFPHRVVQAVLLRGLVEALASLPFAETQRSQYLLYHRDWLLRSGLKQGGKGGGPRKMEEVLARFAGEVERLGDSIQGLQRMACIRWSGGDEAAAAATPEERAWGRALARLAWYLQSTCDDPAHAIDPFAELPLFPPVFKALNGFANQLGLNPLNEALAHHLLLVATAPTELRQRPVRLKPEIVTSAVPIEARFDYLPA